MAAAIAVIILPAQRKDFKLPFRREVRSIYLQIVRSDTEGTALTILARTKRCIGVMTDPMIVERALVRHISKAIHCIS